MTEIEELETRIRNLPKEDFLKNQDTQDIACYRLLVAIEAALGLCYHIAQQDI